ncbi:MAG: hypothetical protein ABIK63_07305, partial [candidate division WOR-3 bacterium]
MRNKYFLLFFGLLIILIFNACQTQKVNKIIIPKEGLQFVSEDGKVLFLMKATEYGGSLFVYNNQGKRICGITAFIYG